LAAVTLASRRLDPDSDTSEKFRILADSTGWERRPTMNAVVSNRVVLVGLLLAGLLGMLAMSSLPAFAHEAEVDSCANMAGACNHQCWLKAKPGEGWFKAKPADRCGAACEKKFARCMKTGCWHSYVVDETFCGLGRY
jgi:hypothetical protein